MLGTRHAATAALGLPPEQAQLSQRVPPPIELVKVLKNRLLHNQESKVYKPVDQAFGLLVYPGH
jgi:hypothetical protein